MDAITILKREILLSLRKESLPQLKTEFQLERINESLQVDDSDYIDKVWDELSDFFDKHREYIDEFRDSFDRDTDLTPRITTPIYDSKEVAKIITGGDGKWIGWLYWYGGGRYDRPELEPWIKTAQVLEMKKEMREVLVPMTPLR